MLIRSVRLVAGEPSIGAIGTPYTSCNAVAITGFLYDAWNPASFSGFAAFQASLAGVLMMSSLTSGFAIRDTCTNGPLLPEPNTLVCCRAVLAYMPITGLADVAAGRPSLVMRVIGTSSAMVLMLAPEKRFTPNGLTLSLSSPGPVSRGG